MANTRASSRNSAKANNWQQEFNHVENHEYFDNLTNPGDISHLDYFKSCSPRSVDKQTLHVRWTDEILPTIEETKNKVLKAQYKRLKKDWDDGTAVTESFWENIEDLEYEITQKRLVRKHRMSLEECAVDQLESAFRYLTKKAKQHHSKVLDNNDDSTPENFSLLRRQTNNTSITLSLDQNDNIQAEEEQEDSSELCEKEREDIVQSLDVSKSSQLQSFNKSQTNEKIDPRDIQSSGKSRSYEQGSEQSSISTSTSLDSRFERMPSTEQGSSIETTPSSKPSIVNGEFSEEPRRQYMSKIPKTVATDPRTKKRGIDKPLTGKKMRYFAERYRKLGEKWVLKSGTVVEDVIFEAGNKISDDTYR
ncbi:hypothetical protein BGZ49_007004 [Haplosporangium sp. Z 27]|nr:hypothetical protein BGZ49_007004 [Haplosporangium sp. Z 27]